jgi:membrane protease YdiL (CAAX protease family)
LVLYIARGYSVIKVNPLSFLLPGFSAALIAGFVAEIIIRGIIFRLIEEQTGNCSRSNFHRYTFYFITHRTNGATILSVTATTIQAGILVSAAYVFTRSLWFPIFFHFAWDFAQPAIFGGINPGITVERNFIEQQDQWLIINYRRTIWSGKFFTSCYILFDNISNIFIAVKAKK